MSGKGGKQQTTINPELAAAARPLIERAGQIAQMPFMPNRGIQFAAFNPMQEAAFANTDAAASAFGLNTSGGNTGLPAPITQNGISGYGTGNIFDTAVQQSLPPAYLDYLNQFFINPQTGAPATGISSPALAPAPNQRTVYDRDSTDADQRREGTA